MNIGLLAFQNAINYGAVLQMYALKINLEKNGHKVEVINYLCEPIEMRNKKIRVPVVPQKTKYKFLKSLYLKLDYLRTQKLWEQKYNKFESFRNEYLNLSNQKYTHVNELNNLDKYNAYIVGSDQIWNPNITNGFDPVFFCDFSTKKNVKKIAYSASCGNLKTISDESNKFYKLINNFDYISAREDELSEFINLKGKSERTLDPSLLLSSEEYNKIAEIPDENDYLLIYKMQNNNELYKAAKRIARERDLTIIELGFPSIKQDRKIKYISDASPQEFLGYFKKAKFVITNSFHGTAFSIIYNLDFLTVPHRSVGQRMIDLLNLLELEGRIINEESQLNDSHLSKINYKRVNMLLNTEINKSIDYIIKSTS